MNEWGWIFSDGGSRRHHDELEQLRRNARRARRRRRRNSHQTNERIEQLEQRIEQLEDNLGETTLLARGLLTYLDECGDVDQERLLNVLMRLDAEDGEQDGQVRPPRPEDSPDPSPAELEPLVEPPAVAPVPKRKRKRQHKDRESY